MVIVQAESPPSKKPDERFKTDSANRMLLEFACLRSSEEPADICGSTSQVTKTRSTRIPARRMDVGSAGLTAAATTTAAATAFFRKVFFCGNPTKLDGGSHVFANFLLKSFEFALGRHETAGDLVFKKRIACTFELTNLGGTQLNSCLLLVVQLLAALMHALILKLRSVIGQEALNVCLEFEKVRITDDLGAQFFGFFDDGGLFGDG